MLIKNLIVFSAELPPIDAIEKHLAELTYRPVTDLQYSSRGFALDRTGERHATPFPGGYRVTLAVDQKVMPEGPLRRRVDEVVAQMEIDRGEPLDKDEKEGVREEVYLSQLETALVSTKFITAYYIEKSKRLLVASSSKSAGQQMVAALIKACESVKTTTIHVDGMKSGITARFRNYVENLPKAFDGFSVGDRVELRGKGGDKVVYQLSNLEHGTQGLLESLNAQMQVTEVELVHADAIEFRLTDQFRMKGISLLADEPELDDDLTEEQRQAHQMGVETALIDSAVDQLCTLFGYQLDVEFDIDNEESN